MHIKSLVLVLANALIIVCLDTPEDNRSPSGTDHSIPRRLDGSIWIPSEHGTWGNNLDLSQMERLNPSAYLRIIARSSAEEPGSRATDTN